MKQALVIREPMLGYRPLTNRFALPADVRNRVDNLCVRVARV